MLTKAKQKGAVLAVGLMMLLILTIMVISSNGSTLLQEKMSSAMLDGQLSLQTVESALEDAETYVNTLSTVSDFNTTGTNGLYAEGSGPTVDQLFASSTWVTGKYRTSNSFTMQNSSLSAIYFVESLGQMTVAEENLSGMNMTGYGQTTGGGNVNAFRIVVKAGGNSGNAERMVEAQFGKRL